MIVKDRLAPVPAADQVIDGPSMLDSHQPWDARTSAFPLWQSTIFCTSAPTNLFPQVAGLSGLSESGDNGYKVGIPPHS